jgi:large subunit ribosomal protein L4
MKLTLNDIKGKSLGDFEVNVALVEDGKGTQAVHDAVVAFRAAQRSGTACTKTMGDVAGTGKKPWRQKGTGRARAGSFASPIWVGGGVVFGPKPRDFRKKISRSTKALALRKAFSERLKASDIVVVDDLKLASAKTKELISVLATLKIDGTVLVVSDIDKNLTLAARNIPHVELTDGTTLNTYQLLRNDKVLFTKSALEKFTARLGN